ncbi:autotransporter-associated beta strand repeat-containing protein, partial [bacterium]|nr:autotransporter-associated beta strand repeat-containing protein [bacterium]
MRRSAQNRRYAISLILIFLGVGELAAQTVLTTATRTWVRLTSSGGGNDRFGRNGNWSGGNEPNASNTRALFTGANLEDPEMNVNRTAGQFHFTSSATRAMTFLEHANDALLTLNADNGDGLIHEGGVTHIFDARFAIANDQTWYFTAANGGLTVNDSFALNGFTLTIDTQLASNTVEFTGSKDPITGTGGFSKEGDGTLVFSGSHSFTGAVDVTAGVVSVRHATGLGTDAGGVTVSSGAALELQGGIAVGSEALTLNGTGISSNGALRNISGTNSWAGAITLGSATEIQSDLGTLTLSGAIGGATQNLTIDGPGNTTISGVIGTTSGTLTKNGSGTLILSAANTFTGATTVSDGVVSVRNSTGLGTTAGGVTVSSGAALELQDNISIGAEALTLSGTGVSNNGALRNDSGTNSYAGAITLGAATEIQSDAGTLTLSGGITGATENLTVDGSGNTTISGIIGTTSGSLTKSGSGTLILSADNTYSGGTTISSGTLQIGNAGTTGSVSGDITNNSALIFDRSDEVTYDGDISGSGSLEQAGSDTLILTGANSHTGGTTISSGTLQIGEAGTTGSVVGNITNNSALIFDRSDAISYGDIISGTGSVTQNGSDTLTLSAANAYTGGTTVNSGTLSLTYGAQIGAIRGDLTINSGATLNSTAANTIGWDATNRVDNIIVDGGTVNHTGDGDFGWRLDWTVSDGAILNSNGGTFSNSSATSGSKFSLSTDSTITATTGTSTINGRVDLRSGTEGSGLDITVNSGAILDIAAGIVDSRSAAGFEKLGDGTLNILGDNAYSGTTTITAGTLSAQDDNALGDTTGGTTVASGATLELTGGIDIGTEALTLNGTGVSSTGALNSVSGDNSVGGAITLGSATEIQTDADSLTLSGDISGATHNLTIDGSGDTNISGAIGTTTGSLSKNGSGTLLLTGANTFSGTTTVNAGTLAVDGNQEQDRLAANAQVTVNSGGTFEYRGVNATSVTDQVDFTVNTGGTLSIVSGESDGGSTTSHIHLGDITLDGGTIDLSYSGTGTAYSGESAQLDGNITVTDDSIIQFGSGATTTNVGLALNGTTSFTVDPSKTLTLSAELEDKDSGANGF